VSGLYVKALRLILYYCRRVVCKEQNVPIAIAWMSAAGKNRFIFFELRLNTLTAFVPTNPGCVRVVGYGPFSLFVNHKDGLCPNSRDIKMMMMMMTVMMVVVVMMMMMMNNA
jgi:hypothetical protein